MVDCNMSHTNAENFYNLKKTSQGKFAEVSKLKAKQQIRFAIYFGPEYEKCSLYPFAYCKEYILDSCLLFYKRPQKPPMESTHLIFKSLSGFEDSFELIKQTIDHANKELGLKESSYHLFDEGMGLSIISDAYWSATPYILSFYAALIRIVYDTNAFVDITKPKTSKSTFDTSIFKYKTYQTFINAVKNKQFSDPASNFLKPEYIHSSGIQHYLSHGKY